MPKKEHAKSLRNIPRAELRRPDEIVTKVWRYLSFSRFVWLLQNKQLWLARADTLEDLWELAIAGDQLDFVIGRHPPQAIGQPRREGPLERAKRINNLWRSSIYVNCWSASEHESHALWRIYCGKEGVAIQTTLSKLRESVGELGVLPVKYGTIGSEKKTPNPGELATRKRPMFSYESEIRIILAELTDQRQLPGQPIPWNIEAYADAIAVHPEADQSFMDTVVRAVSDYAPALKKRVVWSAMKEQPPLLAK